MRCQKRGGNRLKNKGLTQENSSPAVGRLQIGLESDAVWTGVGCGLDWSRLPSGLRLFCEMAWNDPPYTLFNLQKADKYSNLGRTRTFTECSARKTVSVRVHIRAKMPDQSALSGDLRALPEGVFIFGLDHCSLFKLSHLFSPSYLYHNKMELVLLLNIYNT